MISKIIWRIYTADPELIFWMYTTLVVLVTAGITSLVFILRRQAAFKAMAGEWAKDEINRLTGRCKALEDLVEELEDENASNASVWTALMGTLSRTKGRRRTLIPGMRNTARQDKKSEVG